MEGASIGFLIGAIVCLMAFMVGRISVDDGSNSDNCSVPDGDRDRSCNKRDISKIEMMAVLGYFQLGANPYERKILGHIMDIIEEGSEEE